MPNRLKPEIVVHQRKNAQTRVPALRTHAHLPLVQPHTRKRALKHTQPQANLGADSSTCAKVHANTDTRA